MLLAEALVVVFGFSPHSYKTANTCQKYLLTKISHHCHTSALFLTQSAFRQKKDSV